MDDHKIYRRLLTSFTCQKSLGSKLPATSEKSRIYCGAIFKNGINSNSLTEVLDLKEFRTLVFSRVGFKARRFFSDRLQLRTARYDEDTSTEVFKTELLSDSLNSLTVVFNDFRTLVTLPGWVLRHAVFFPDRLQLLSDRCDESLEMYGSLV